MLTPLDFSCLLLILRMFFQGQNLNFDVVDYVRARKKSGETSCSSWGGPWRIAMGAAQAHLGDLLCKECATSGVYQRLLVVECLHGWRESCERRRDDDNLCCACLESVFKERNIIVNAGPFTRRCGCGL